MPLPAGRLGSGILFALGLLLTIAFGCLLAAYDLWGGVPRQLWPTARWLLRGGVACLLTGGVGFIWSHPAGQRARALWKSALALAALGTLGGAALWFHYLSRWKTSRLICAPALIAPERATREAALRDGLGPLFPVIDPHGSCLTLLREQRALEDDGTCPSFVMLDTACRCGRQAWSPGNPPACPNGPTACQSRDGATTLGCAEHGTSYLLEEAARALKDRAGE